MRREHDGVAIHLITTTYSRAISQRIPFGRSSIKERAVENSTTRVVLAASREKQKHKDANETEMRILQDRDLMPG